MSITVPYVLHQRPATSQAPVLPRKKTAATSAWQIIARTERATNMMSGPVQVIWPAAARFWISPGELTGMTTSSCVLTETPPIVHHLRCVAHQGSLALLR
jgi:hypothetical protein